MVQAHIMPVASYDEFDRIKAFIKEAISTFSRPADVFREGGRPPLVVVKPNWVQESHEYRPDCWEPVITHPAVVLATVECLAEAMNGQGAIALCDAPHTYADFNAILGRGNLQERLDALRAKWPRLNVETLDLRREVWITKEQVVVSRRPNPPDPRGYVRLNLGKDSLFHHFRGEGRYYGADYDQGVVNRHHRGEVQEYLIAGTPMACDLFVNVPKLKTHKKTGITCCLKNLVGINGDKNWLPHHTDGSPRSGGDEFAEESLGHAVERGLKRQARRLALSAPGVGPWALRKMRNVGKRMLGDSETVIRNGNWHGNDTCWRMALDLNRGLLYGNADGSWREPPAAKRYLAIVDGIVGGQGNGPVCPEPAESGVLLAGANPAVVDAVAARVMGFDPMALPIARHAFDAHRWPIADGALDEILVHDGRCGRDILLAELEAALAGGFRPHFGWPPLRTRV